MRAPAFIVRTYGDLGNVLHTFINAAALAVENQRFLANLAFTPFSEYFAGTASCPVACYPAQTRSVSETLAFAMRKNWLQRLLYSAKWRRRLAPVLFTLDAPDDFEVREGFPALSPVAADPRAVVIYAWNLHLPALVERHAEKLRAYFSLSPVWRQRLDDWLALEPRPAQWVGVHIRRFGPNYGPGEQYYRTDDFYRARMREMADALGPGTGFLICSDAPVDLANFAGLPVRLGPGHRILDLYALASCDWIFGPYSTFSAWASWVGKVPRFQAMDDQPLQLANFRVHRFD
jgi:hypothetical protein